MAVLVGNLTLLVDTISLRTGLPDRRTRLAILDYYSQIVNNVSLSTKSNNSESSSSFSHDDKSEMKNFLFGINNKKRMINLKSNSSMDFDSEFNGEEDEGDDNFESWEQEMRKRVKELEELKELERKAEELQNTIDDDDDGGGEDEFRRDDEDTEEKKRIRVRKELEKVAKEQAERKKTATLMFDLGQKAYSKGMYGRAVEFLEGALTIIPRPTMFGGEIQIWLAMAYEANNRHADCIALYKQLERKHPSVSIRRQAKELRYILQAPKLKISKDEMVTIPLIGSSYDSYAGTWSDKYKDQPPIPSGGTTNQLPSNKDYLGDFMASPSASGWENNRTLWAFVAVWVSLVGVALIIQR
ncbi:hypothetical protein MKW94_026810 [Papaver nudicaule]|uniref:Uncharacterized protein n=1 Tax=Papaver nudicaule TaxID=74823 RepID=A0AA41VQ62_PAPNU|nr:hypothetical protein [Papaver nudicaule]